jgi:hypothetical protein
VLAAALLAAALAADPAATAPPPAPTDLRAGDPTEDPFDPDYNAGRDEDREHRRLTLIAWGGQLSGLQGSGQGTVPFAGGEVTWSLGGLDLGVLAQGYRLRDAARDWSPVILARATQRFQTRRGLDATFTFGAGAARPDAWRAWFQVALGVRLDLGPAFLAGELGFEQDGLVRFGAGLGLRL